MTRLSRAIDQADEQMDVALRRTEEVHRMTAARREREIQELRQVIAVKERGIDSLRETLSCTKRSLESRIRELEALLRRKDEEVKGPQLLSYARNGTTLAQSRVSFFCDRSKP